MSQPVSSLKRVPRFRSWDALRRPIWMFDPHNLRGIYANGAALELWGAESLEELLARDFSQLSPAVRARTANLAEATSAGAAVHERWTFYPKGQPVTVQATISTHSLNDGRKVLLFEAAPLEVEAGERRAVEALRHASTLISLFDENGDLIFANPAALSAYGLVGSVFSARFSARGRGASMFATALAGDAITEVCEALTCNGSRWHHLDARPALDPVTGARAVLLNETDVTLRVEAERARAAAEQKAAMAETRQRFLTDMSHELRTPLNCVIGFSELLTRADLNRENRDQAHRIHRSGMDLLSVVNHMIELSASEGKVECDSASPLSYLDDNREAALQSAPRAIRVLYVEDNLNNQALVRAILNSQDVYCEMAHDGAQGVEAAKSGDWDIILMDIQMPVMTGVQATRAIRAISGPAGAVPIVAVTANTLPEQMQEYALAGMNDVLAKPFNTLDLINKIAIWIETDWSDNQSDAENGPAWSASA